jgi:hypothetical protein
VQCNELAVIPQGIASFRRCSPVISEHSDPLNIKIKNKLLLKTMEKKH